MPNSAAQGWGAYRCLEPVPSSNPLSACKHGQSVSQRCQHPVLRTAFPPFNDIAMPTRSHSQNLSELPCAIIPFSEPTGAPLTSHVAHLLRGRVSPARRLFISTMHYSRVVSGRPSLLCTVSLERFEVKAGKQALKRSVITIFHVWPSSCGCLCLCSMTEQCLSELQGPGGRCAPDVDGNCLH
jgi:hypothetical protein